MRGVVQRPVRGVLVAAVRRSRAKEAQRRGADPAVETRGTKAEVAAYHKLFEWIDICMMSGEVTDQEGALVNLSGTLCLLPLVFE